jgi:hypothetical protein
VHLVSKVSQGPVTLALNVQLASDGGRAQVSLTGFAFEVIRIGKTMYLKGNPILYKRLGIAASVPQHRWLQAPVSGQLGQLAAFTDLSGELNRLLPARNDALAKGASTTVEGHHALELKAIAQLFTGILYVPTTGKPYPIELTKHGREAGQSIFSEWNKPITLKPPTNAIELSQLERKDR